MSLNKAQIVSIDPSFNVDGAEHVMSDIVGYFNHFINCEFNGQSLFLTRLFFPVIRRVVASGKANPDSCTDDVLNAFWRNRVINYPVVPIFCNDPNLEPQGSCAPNCYAQSQVPWTVGHPDYYKVHVTQGNILPPLRIYFNYQWMKRVGYLRERLLSTTIDQDRRQYYENEIAFHRVVVLDKLLQEYVRCFTEMILDYEHNLSADPEGRAVRTPVRVAPVKVNTFTGSSTASPVATEFIGDMGYSLQECLIGGNLRLKMDYQSSRYGWTARGLYFEKGTSKSLQPTHASTAHLPAVGTIPLPTVGTSSTLYPITPPGKGNQGKKSRRDSPVEEVVIQFLNFNDYMVDSMDYAENILNCIQNYDGNRTEHNAELMFRSFLVDEAVSLFQEGAEIVGQLSAEQMSRKYAVAGAVLYGEEAKEVCPLRFHDVAPIAIPGGWRKS
jgi:hypothetical protein